eukprot:scaffold133834_cov32-Tisochrysis_lutea.AAC.1
MVASHCCGMQRRRTVLQLSSIRVSARLEQRPRHLFVTACGRAHQRCRAALVCQRRVCFSTGRTPAPSATSTCAPAVSSASTASRLAAPTAQWSARTPFGSARSVRARSSSRQRTSAPPAGARLACIRALAPVTSAASAEAPSSNTAWRAQAQSRRAAACSSSASAASDEAIVVRQAGGHQRDGGGPGRGRAGGKRKERRQERAERR